MSDNAAGWQPDPTGKHDHRYWDGTQWTDNVADAGVASTDPYEAAGGGRAEVAEPGAAEPEPLAAPPRSPPSSRRSPSGDTTDVVTPTAPAPPPPYVPPTPDRPAATARRRQQARPGDRRRHPRRGRASRSWRSSARRRRRRERRARPSSPPPSRTTTDVSAEQAECVADLVVDEAGEDAVRGHRLQRRGSAAGVHRRRCSRSASTTVVEECGIDEEAFGGTDGTTDRPTDDGGDERPSRTSRTPAPTATSRACDDLYFSADLGSDLEEFGSTCGGIADPQSGLVRGHQRRRGRRHAPPTGSPTATSRRSSPTPTRRCSASAASRPSAWPARSPRPSRTASLTEEQAMTEIFDYLADCDISMEEISGELSPG